MKTFWISKGLEKIHPQDMKIDFYKLEKKPDTNHNPLRMDKLDVKAILISRF